SYAAWGFSGGVWSMVGEVWVKGHWTTPSKDIFFPCTWSDYNSSGSLNTVPAGATKLRIAAAEWTETGTKGASGTDSFRPVVAGIAAGTSCPPGVRASDDATF